MRRLWRYWPWLPPGRAELVAIMIGIALVAAVLVAMIKVPNFSSSSHTGFGPDWNCEQMPYGGSVCIKKPPPGLPNKAKPTD